MWSLSMCFFIFDLKYLLSQSGNTKIHGPEIPYYIILNLQINENNNNITVYPVKGDGPKSITPTVSPGCYLLERMRHWCIMKYGGGGGKRKAEINFKRVDDWNRFFFHFDPRLWIIREWKKIRNSRKSAGLCVRNILLSYGGEEKCIKTFRVHILVAGGHSLTI